MGKGTQKPIVFDFSREIIGTPYFLGYDHSNNGIDCFTLIVKYLEKFSIYISEDEILDGINLINYKDKYLEDNSIIMIADKYLSKKFKPKSPSRSFTGDIVMLDYNGKFFFGIDAGNGNILTVNTKTGAKIVHGDIYRILKAWPIR